MTFNSTMSNRFINSLDHESLLRDLTGKPDLLLIQDLDGVCMGLVTDPLRRSIDPDYVQACRDMAGEFFVLTNGEHLGSRGVNAIVERAFDAHTKNWPQQHGLYLPGLGAGGVQFQDRFANVTHPGVTEAELEFLSQVPDFLAQNLSQLLAAPPFGLTLGEIKALLQIVILPNAVSPTLNIGTLYDYWQGNPEIYVQAQHIACGLMEELLELAAAQGLVDSFFVHLAPNLGSSGEVEQLKPGSVADMGTTDFQFMLRGAVKEMGVMVLLNQYYFARTGEFPLGESFNARTAAGNRAALLDLAEYHFDPKLMPAIVGVGDTLTSHVTISDDGKRRYSRGGSDRGFLTLLQELGHRLQADSQILWVDSSGDELNRPGISPKPAKGDLQVPYSAMQGVTDCHDPLTINGVFPGGYRQYIRFFKNLAKGRRMRTKL